MTFKQTWVIESEHVMHCSGCEQTVEFTLSRLPDVIKAQANYRTQQIEIHTSASDLDEKIILTLKNLGYRARKLDVDEDFSI